MNQDFRASDGRPKAAWQPTRLFHGVPERPEIGRSDPVSYPVCPMCSGECRESPMGEQTLRSKVRVPDRAQVGPHLPARGSDSDGDGIPIAAARSSPITASVLSCLVYRHRDSHHTSTRYLAANATQFTLLVVYFAGISALDCFAETL